MPTADETRALLTPDLDVLHHGLELAVAHGWSHLRRRIETIAHPQRLGACGKLFEERLVEFLVHDHAARRGAALAAGPEAAPEAAFHRQFQVGVVHDQDDVLAAHLEMHLLEGWRGLTGHGAADLGRPGKRHDADGVTDQQRVADIAAAARNEVDDAARDP